MSIVASQITENFLQRLDGVRKTGSGWQARCPCRNDDSNPSLSVGQGDDGRVLVTCHRGQSCDVEAICASVGLHVSDLMPGDDTLSSAKSFLTEKPLKINKPSQPPKQALKTTLVESYDYVDADGNILFQKLRYIDEEGKKTFRQRKPDGRGGWEYSLGDTPKVLYNLPLVLAAKQEGIPIWLVEGEKDANTLASLGEIATTMPGGAGKWLDIHIEALAGAVVEIIADHDEVGIAHAKRVFETLIDAGCDAQVWMCPEAKDVSDHIGAGGELNELIAIEEYRFTEQENIGIQESINNKSTEDDEEQESLEEMALSKLQDLLDRKDISPLQKIAKSNLIIATASMTRAVDTGRLVQWNDFLGESDDESYEWVIPGLLEKSERVIVVAAEGVGKTMLARQVAILSSCGIHPLSLQPMPRVRTLTVDLENPEKIIRRTSRAIAKDAMAYSRTDRFDAYVLTKPAGMDLMKASDRAVLEQAIEDVKPEILLIGPLYKAFLDPGGRTSESVALEVAKYLDTIRVVYGCALWIEHHAPLGSSMTSRELRPFGSAVWSRWPEFGISLTPDPTALGEYVYDVKHFRGARDERHWPTKMRRGKRFPFEVIEWNHVSK